MRELACFRAPDTSRAPTGLDLKHVMRPLVCLCAHDTWRVGIGAESESPRA